MTATITVRVTPRSGRSAVEFGPRGVTVRVRAAAEGGRATTEAAATLARALGLPASAVRLHTGARSRTKIFLVEGLDPGEAEQRLRAL
jgi:uncharacterized protein YggU (UPF0235/DUF167 family)